MLTSLVLLAGSAYAAPTDLDCAGLGLELTSCEAANQVAQLVHNELPDQISAENSGRFNTLRTYTVFQEITDAATANGCTVDGVMGGKYVKRVWNGFSQALGSSAFPAAMQGVYDVEVRTILGDFNGGDDNVSDLWGRVHRLRYLTNTDGVEENFIAGTGLRIRGTKGAFVSLYGSCDGPANEALAPWFGQNLEKVTFDRVHPILNESCGSCHFVGNALGVGGSEIVAVGDADPIVAFAASEEVCNIGSGVTCGEESVDFIVDEHKPSAASGGPLSPGVQALFTQWLNGGLLDAPAAD